MSSTDGTRPATLMVPFTARAGVIITPDFTTELNIVLQTEAVQMQEVRVEAERPLLQKDATGTTRFISGADIQKLPTRGYRDAVAQQAGVVNFARQIETWDPEKAKKNYETQRAKWTNDAAKAKAAGQTPPNLGDGLPGLVSHLGHEWVILSNLLCLLLGYPMAYAIARARPGLRPRRCTVSSNWSSAVSEGTRFDC